MLQYESKMFKDLLKQIGYTKRKVYVQASEDVTLQGLNWDGGSRSSYTTFDLVTGKIVGDASKYAQMAPWVNPAEGKTLPIPENFLVIRHGVFMGKQATAYLYVNPKNMPMLLGNDYNEK